MQAVYGCVDSSPLSLPSWILTTVSCAGMPSRRQGFVSGDLYLGFGTWGFVPSTSPVHYQAPAAQDTSKIGGLSAVVFISMNHIERHIVYMFIKCHLYILCDIVISIPPVSPNLYC